MTTLSIQSLYAAPYGTPLLENIDLELEAGQVLGVIGPNGAGKSSLLHCIAGGLPAKSGRILFDGSSLDALTSQRRARCTAMQVQHSALNFPFSVEEVILLGRTPHASGQRRDRLILDEVMLATDTADLAHRPYTQLSGGEKQRVQLARAVAQVWREEDASHRLLLLDEPNSALDLSPQRMVLEVVRQMAATGCTVLMATHDFNLLSPHADRLLVMQNGKQYGYGTPEEVLRARMFKEVFAVDVSIQQRPGSMAPLVIHQ